MLTCNMLPVCFVSISLVVASMMRKFEEYFSLYWLAIYSLPLPGAVLLQQLFSYVAPAVSETVKQLPVARQSYSPPTLSTLPNSKTGQLSQVNSNGLYLSSLTPSVSFLFSASRYSVFDCAMI